MNKIASIAQQLQRSYNWIINYRLQYLSFTDSGKLGYVSTLTKKSWLEYNQAVTQLQSDLEYDLLRNKHAYYSAEHVATLAAFKHATYIHSKYDTRTIKRISKRLTYLEKQIAKTKKLCNEHVRETKKEID